MQYSEVKDTYRGFLFIGTHVNKERRKEREKKERIREGEETRSSSLL